MKYLYIFLLLGSVFEFKASHDDVAQEIISAINEVSLIRNETVEHAYLCVMSGYERKISELASQNNQEKELIHLNEQVEKIKNAYLILKGYGLENKTKFQIEDILSKNIESLSKFKDKKNQQMPKPTELELIYQAILHLEIEPCKDMDPDFLQDVYDTHTCQYENGYKDENYEFEKITKSYKYLRNLFDSKQLQPYIDDLIKLHQSKIYRIKRK